MTNQPTEEPMPARIAYSWNDLRETGMLWLINRSLFHPAGLALALEYAEDETEPRGWALKSNAEDEPYSFLPEVDRERMRTVRAHLNAARKHGKIPLDEPLP